MSKTAFDHADLDALKQLAAKYIWWKAPAEAMASPKRIIAQVMNLGDFDDVNQMAVHFGDDVLREVLVDAEAGLFSDRSWHYWHYRLGLAKVDEVPPLPVRTFR